MKKIIKGIILTVAALILIPLIGFGAVYGPTLYKIQKIKHPDSSDITYVDTSLTVDQKLSDLEYMYKIVCLDNPNKDLYEKAYGISYEDIYGRYRKLVADSETEYEYLAYLRSFLAIIPGLHNGMDLPNYELTASQGMFSLIEVFADKGVIDYTYSWKEDFRDDVRSAKSHNIIAFKYVDGGYVNVGSNNTKIPFINDYERGRLLSLDGKDPKDLCFDLLAAHIPKYDCENNCFFRETLIFNDEIGIKHTAEIQMPDGSIVTTDVYEDPGFELAVSNGSATYPELFTDTGSSNAETNTSASSDVPTTYRIYTDPARKLVYLDSLSCSADEGDHLVGDLQKAIDEVGATSVIVDIRSNEGGDYTFATEQLLPALFSHDVQFKSEVIGGKNDHTKRFYGNLFYRFNNRSNSLTGIRTDADYFYNTEDFSVTGNAKRDYKIYLLTSQRTFSTGDIIARLCKEYDNAVIVGTNTGGEGISGTPFNCYLPISHFMFAYSPTTNKDYPDDSFYGTLPDVYVPFTLEEYYARLDMSEQGLDVDSYETRQEWDQALLKVLDMIDM